MRREQQLGRLLERPDGWDLLVVGGGATGLGIALDAAARGCATALCERGDFGQGTSSRSTKLIHGGVRYLQQGNFSLVLEALRERGVLLRLAPHLVRDLPLVVPIYDWWESPFYGLGLRIYDLMAGRLGFGKSQRLDRDQTVARIPTVATEGLRGGVLYHDGQFDDARLALNLAQTAVEQGAVTVSYCPVTALVEDQGQVSGAVVRDLESGREHSIRARVVINATGPFCDGLRQLDDASARPMIAPSRGSHLVLPREFLPTEHAILVPHTSDGRLIFVIPWHDVVLVGTTDEATDEVPEEPSASGEEVDFLLETASRYLSRNPTRADVLSVFAGIRPLVASGGPDTAVLSREHTLSISDSGLFTIAGGKWTTYRKMAQDVVDQAVLLADCAAGECRTTELPLHGAAPPAADPRDFYGSDLESVRELEREDPTLAERLHPDLAPTRAQVVWAAREEMARTVEDVLARRTRSLIRNARAAREAAPAVARILSRELGRDAAWEQREVARFVELADTYLPRS